MKTQSAIAIIILCAAASFGEVPWDESALADLQQARPEDALKTAKPHADSRRGQILLFAAYAQEYDQSKNAGMMAKSTELYKDLLPQVTIEDAVILHSLRRIQGSMLHSYSETLLDQALRRITKPGDAMAVPAVLSVIYPTERYKVFASLSDWLASQRARVLKKETLDAETRQVFTDEKLISALLDALDTRKKAPGKAPMQAFASPPPNVKPTEAARPTPPPRMLPPRTNATARECLILIEEPAIPLVQARLSELGDDGFSLLSDLCAAKTVRESEAPGFMWTTTSGN